jgi:hypothetical protein
LTDLPRNPFVRHACLLVALAMAQLALVVFHPVPALADLLFLPGPYGGQQ